MKLNGTIGLIGLGMLLGTQAQASDAVSKTDYSRLTVEAANSLGISLAELRDQHPLTEKQDFGYKVDPATSAFDISIFDQEQFAEPRVDHTSAPKQ